MIVLFYFLYVPLLEFYDNFSSFVFMLCGGYFPQVRGEMKKERKRKTLFWCVAFMIFGLSEVESCIFKEGNKVSLEQKFCFSAKDNWF